MTLLPGREIAMPHGTARLRICPILSNPHMARLPGLRRTRALPPEREQAFRLELVRSIRDSLQAQAFQHNVVDLAMDGRLYTSC